MHLCRWHHRAYGRWETGRKHLLQQCVSSLSDRKQRWQELELPVVPLSERNSAARTGQPRTLGLEEQQENGGKQDEEGDGILEYESPSDDDDIPSLERKADFYLWRGSHFGRSIRFNGRIVKLIFLYLRCYGTMGLSRPFVFYALVKIVIRFISLIRTCLYLYVCPWSKFNERKSSSWLTYVIPARFWKLLTWTISSFWWKEITLRLTVTIDFNGSMLVKKTITHRKGPSNVSLWNGIRQNCTIGIGIGRYKPSG